MSEIDEITQEFLSESRESLERIDLDLLDLESSGSTPDGVDRIFRAVHTIKGTCGFLGFARLESLSHAGENLLSRIRDGRIAVSRSVADALLELFDAIRSLLSEVEATGTDGSGDDAGIIGRIEALADTGANPIPPPAPALNHEREAGSKVAGGIPAEMPPPARATQPVETSIRVDTAVLDELMNQVGELVLARNQFQHVSQRKAVDELPVIAQKLNSITAGLQRVAMKTRMQPVAGALNKLPRFVRDVALGCGKEIRVEVDGGNTELDRTLIEAIQAPLTHLVRNAVDHGIETPQARRAAGKPAVGTIGIRASHAGGEFHLVVADDGAGLDMERIRARAVERGLIRRDQLETMPDEEVAEIIFAPGFSTAVTVTSLSGRGVGMDVVKTAVEAIGGTVSVTSRSGLGTTVRFVLPLTLAILPALIVKAGGRRYAIPRAHLRELVTLRAEAARRAIERVHSRPVYRLRGRLLPLEDLGEALGLGAGERDESVLHMAVVQAGGCPYALRVDDIEDTLEVVVKPLDPLLRKVRQFSGATILGDGEVGLILDVQSLNPAHGTPEPAVGGPAQDEAVSGDLVHARSEVCLMVRAGSGGPIALPLTRVVRLARIPASTVEPCGTSRVVQYDGRVMPLVPLSGLFAPNLPVEMENPDVLNVVVYEEESGDYTGLIVDEILDSAMSVPGTPRSADDIPNLRIIQGRVARWTEPFASVASTTRTPQASGEEPR